MDKVVFIMDSLDIELRLTLTAAASPLSNDILVLLLGLSLYRSLQNLLIYHAISLCQIRYSFLYA
jgi:hypothetical protein